jgi:hypothetical protein
MKRSIPNPVRSFLAALGLVTVAMAGFVTLEDPDSGRSWPAVAAPLVPAAYVLASFFTGGIHGMSLPRLQALAAIFGIGLLMWWAIIEGCRRVWSLARRTHPRSS